MKHVVKGGVYILAIVMCFYAYGSYSTNTTSTIKWVKIYTYTNVIYFELDGPVDTACANNYFVIDSAGISEALINRLYSTLLAAKSSGASVSIGHGVTLGDCYQNSTKAYAVKLNE